VYRGGMRGSLVVVLLMVAGGGKEKPPPPRPELIEVVRDLADRACECGTDRHCVRSIRDEEWEPRKYELQQHGLTGADQAAFDAELARLRACGDAAGTTIWL
jgi:hypothetical protein